MAYRYTFPAWKIVFIETISFPGAVVCLYTNYILLISIKISPNKRRGIFTSLLSFIITLRDFLMADLQKHVFFVLYFLKEIRILWFSRKRNIHGSSAIQTLLTLFVIVLKFSFVSHFDDNEYYCSPLSLYFTSASTKYVQNFYLTMDFTPKLQKTHHLRYTFLFCLNIHQYLNNHRATFQSRTYIWDRKIRIFKIL